MMVRPVKTDSIHLTFLPLLPAVALTLAKTEAIFNVLTPKYYFVQKVSMKII